MSKRRPKPQGSRQRFFNPHTVQNVPVIGQQSQEEQIRAFKMGMANMQALAAQIYTESIQDVIIQSYNEDRDTFEQKAAYVVERAVDAATVFARKVFGLNVRRQDEVNVQPPTPIDADAPEAPVFEDKPAEASSSNLVAPDGSPLQ